MTLENPASCKQFHAFEVSLCKIWSWDNLIHHQFAYDEGHTDYIYVITSFTGESQCLRRLASEMPLWH